MTDVIHHDRLSTWIETLRRRGEDARSISAIARKLRMSNGDTRRLLEDGGMPTDTMLGRLADEFGVAHDVALVRGASADPAHYSDAPEGMFRTKAKAAGKRQPVGDFVQRMANAKAAKRAGLAATAPTAATPPAINGNADVAPAIAQDDVALAEAVIGLLRRGSTNAAEIARVRAERDEAVVRADTAEAALASARARLAELDGLMGRIRSAASQVAMPANDAAVPAKAA